MSLDRLLREIVRYAREQYGRWPKRFHLDLDNDEKVVLPIPPAFCQAIPSNIEGVAEDLAAAIFGYLDGEGERRTRAQVAAALADDFSESAIGKALWRMRLAGILDNPRGGGGYGLAEWVKQ